MTYPDLSPEEFAQNRGQHNREFAALLRKVADILEQDQYESVGINSEEMAEKYTGRGRVAMSYSEADENIHLMVNIKKV